MQNLSLNILELMNFLPGVAFSFDVGGEYGLQFVSESVHQLVGYAQAEFKEDPTLWLQLVHPEDREEVRAGLQAVLSASAYSQEYRFLHREGHALWVRAEMKVVTSIKDEALGIVGFWTDVSKRRRLEQNLRESEERWKYALEGSNAGVWDWHIKTGEVYFAPGWKRMLGFADDEITNHVSEWKKRVHPEDWPMVTRELDEHLSHKKPMYSNEHRVLCRDGSYKWILDRGKVVVRDEQGQPLRMIGTHSDITVQRQVLIQLSESEQRYRCLVEEINDLIWETDVNMVFQYVSPRVKDYFGYEMNEFIGQKYCDFMDPLEMERVAQIIAPLLAARAPLYHIENVMLHKSGYPVVLETSATPKFSAQDEFLGYRGVCRNITYRKRVEEELRASQELFMKAFQMSPVLMAITRLQDGTFLEVNDVFLRTLRYNREEVLGHNSTEMRIFNIPDSRDKLLEEIFRKGSARNLEIAYRDKRGKIHKGLFFAEPVVIAGQECLLSVALDITKRKKYEERIRYQAYHDLLTGLPNRRMFEERLQYVLADARRKGEMVAVLFLDLDGFKQVNDTLGHEAGDKVLCDIAAALTRSLRESDTVARLGGDEFMIILPHLQSTDDANPVINRILNACRKDYSSGEVKLAVSASIGVAFFPAHGTRVSTLMKNADIAMYRAKDAGRDQAVFYQ